MSVRVQPPDPPYLGPARFHGSAQHLAPLKRIVIHCTVSPCVRGGARGIAAYFRKTVTRPSSAHYVVDPGEVVQVVGDHTVAYHAPPNSDTIGIELCDPQAGPVTRWDDVNHLNMLRLAAHTTAQLALAFDVPIRKLTPHDLGAGTRGICGHVDVSNTWHQTTHTDPGVGFPWDRFMAMVRESATALSATPSPVVVKPIPTPSAPRQPMQPAMRIVTSNIQNLPDLTRAQVRHDTAAVSKLGGVICWQEIAEDDDREDLATSLPAAHWQHVNLDTECPISLYRGNWQVIETGHVLLTKGRKRVSPNRYASWAKVARKPHPDRFAVNPLVIVNTHWVSGAFTHPGQRGEAWRAENWQTDHDRQASLVQGFLDQGLTVLGGGDFNRPGVWDGFSDSHQWLMHGGYDHLWAAQAEGGNTVKLTETGTLPLDKLYTDHPARWARVVLTSPKMPVTGKAHV